MSASRWGLVLSGLLLAAAAVWFKWFKPQPALPVPVAEAPVEPVAPVSAPPPVDYPVPAATVDAPALPALADSDAAFRDALMALPGAGALAAWLVPDMPIQRLVVTIDNLPRDRVAVKLRPLKPVPGAFLVDVAPVGYLIGVANAARYSALLTLLQTIDSDALVALYFRWYPLFQQAYRELGYPDGKFNNRVIAVLDHLIATPDLDDPLPLLRPKVHYEFAESAQENASAGHRLLWRIGRDHRRALIARLTVLRSKLAAGAATPAP